MFINAVKGIKLPGIFKNVHAEYCSAEEIQEDPDCINFVQYWVSVDREDIQEAEKFCQENNFDYWY